MPRPPGYRYLVDFRGLWFLVVPGNSRYVTGVPRAKSEYEASRDRFDVALCAALLEAAEARRAGEDMAVWFIAPAREALAGGEEGEQRVIWEVA